MAFLEHLRYPLPGPFIVIWDRNNIHDKSQVVKAYLARHPGIHIERFPAYAPELNPDEQVWSQTKYGRLANYTPQDIQELRATVREELFRLKHRADLLAGCVQYTGLSVSA